MKRIGSAMDGAFWLAGPVTELATRGTGAEVGAGIGPGDVELAGVLKERLAATALMAKVVGGASLAANDGDEAAVGLILAGAHEAPFLKESVEVHRAAVRLRAQFGAVGQDREGFENPHERLRGFETARIDRNDIVTHSGKTVNACARRRFDAHQQTQRCAVLNRIPKLK
jgi:hypothetical protein